MPWNRRWSTKPAKAVGSTRTSSSSPRSKKRGSSARMPAAISVSERRWLTWRITPLREKSSCGKRAPRADAHRADGVEGEIAGRTEQEGQHQARNDENERHSRTAGLAHDPRADEEVEGEIVQPSGE